MGQIAQPKGEADGEEEVLPVTYSHHDGAADGDVCHGVD